MNSHNHWLSNTLTKRMAPAISEILKGNSRRIWRESSISDWQANGELNVSCLGSAQHLCDVVFFSKKMTLILRYTESILCDRKSSVLGVSSRMILHVKSVSSSTIYGITLYLKHRKEPNVGWSLTQSFQFSQNTLANFKVEFPNGIPGLHLWIVAEVCYHGCYQYIDCLPKSKYRLTTVTWLPWMHRLRARSRAWMISSLSWIVLVPQVMWVGCSLNSEWLLVG